MGVGVSFLPRPFGASGRVRTLATPYFSWRLLSVDRAKSGLPMKHICDVLKDMNNIKTWILGF